MNSWFSIAPIVSTFVLMAGSGSGKTGMEPAPAQTLSIHLYDRAQAPAPTLDSATGQANYLFRAVGIRIKWECPSPELPEDRGTDMTSAAFQQPDARPYVVVRLIRRTPATVFPGALGYALPFARTGAHVVIFYDRVEILAHSANEAVDVVLGYAMAHEIGHVLLGSSEHARGGLMQARWTSATWRLASSGLLVFTHEEAERMSAGLQKFQVRNVFASAVSQP
ncbi:MAG TPA: hypothetical protein VH351_00935 [Bryobacteraceae bacterium]|jgi:hypothetical protein|nr:hypothetical protein [Bryobacteraceae bacterium]